MAFNPANLQMVSRKRGHKGNKFWHYTTTDALATIIASGYFNKAAASFAKYDVIFIIDSNVPTYDVIFVSSASHAATVTTVNAT